MTDKEKTKLSELEIYALTDVGLIRSGNEDNFLIAECDSHRAWTASTDAVLAQSMRLVTGEKGILLAVADGLGGAMAGEVASHMAVTIANEKLWQVPELIGPYPFSEQLRFTIEQVNAMIFNESANNVNCTGMGSTFTAAAIDGDRAYIAQVGDSRCYLIRDGNIVQLTKDQSLVGQLVEANFITEDEAEEHPMRNVILQALGAQKHVNVIVDMIKLYQDDILVLCSDGLSGKVKRKEILAVINATPDVKLACHELVDLANDRGGEDNISVIVARIGYQDQANSLSTSTTEKTIEKLNIPRDMTLPVELILEPTMHSIEWLPATDELVIKAESTPDNLLPNRTSSARTSLDRLAPHNLSSERPLSVMPVIETDRPAPVAPIVSVKKLVSQTRWGRFKRWLFRLMIADSHA